MKTIYLSGPIAGISEHDARGWREECKRMLGHAYHLSDPFERPYVGDPGMVSQIVAADKAAINSSDLLLVNVQNAGWGTAMEIAYAHAAGKWIVGFNMPNQMSPWLLYHVAVRYPNLSTAIAMLLNMAELVRATSDV